MSNILAYSGKVVGGGSSSSGGGHIIENPSGTEMEQRSNLQFKGVRVSDDSTNDATIIDSTNETIEWSTWNAMTSAQQEAYVELHPNLTILDAPGVDGSINTDIMTKLWENESPTSDFATQTINLSSSDYDFLLWDVIHKKDNYHLTFLIPKGTSAVFNLTANGTNNSITRQRNANYTNATAYLIDNGYTQNSNQSRTQDNTVLIPNRVYGIKQSVTVDVSAIISDVSTSADKCMLDTGVSVETGCYHVYSMTSSTKYQDISGYIRNAVPIVSFTYNSDTYYAFPVRRANAGFDFIVPGYQATGVYQFRLLTSGITIYNKGTVGTDSTVITDSCSNIKLYC